MVTKYYYSLIKLATHVGVQSDHERVGVVSHQRRRAPDSLLARDDGATALVHRDLLKQIFIRFIT